MTPATVLATVRDQVVEVSPDFWTDAEIYRYMSAAESIINSMLGCYEVSGFDTTVSDLESYDVPTRFVYFTHVQFDSVKLKQITFRDREAMENIGYGGTISTGNTHSYILYGNEILLYPIPDRSASLYYRYIADPADITSSSTTFSIPVAMTNFIADYVLYRMYAKDQEADRSIYHKKLWDEGLARCSDIWSKRNQSDRFSVVRVEDASPSTDLGII